MAPAAPSLRDRESRQATVDLGREGDGARTREKGPDLGPRVGDPRLEAVLVEPPGRFEIVETEFAQDGARTRHRAVRWQLGRDAITGWPAALLTLASGIGLLVFRINATWLIVAGALAGLILRLG